MDTEPDINPTIPPRLHHVGLLTGDLKAMKDWYRIVLGTEPTHEGVVAGTGPLASAQASWLTNDGAHHRLVITSVEGLANGSDHPPRRRLQRLAFQYETMDDLLNSYSRLNSVGVVPVVSMDHGAVTSLYYLDPDGNLLELTADNFPDTALTTEHMKSSAEFAANPLGTLVDPDTLVLERSEGMPLEELHSRAYAGKFAPHHEVDLSVLL